MESNNKEKQTKMVDDREVAAAVAPPVSGERNLNVAEVRLAYSNDSDDEDMMRAYRESLKESEERGKSKPPSLNNENLLINNRMPLSNVVAPRPYYNFGMEPAGSNSYTTTPAMPMRVTPWGPGGPGLTGLPTHSSTHSSGRNSAPPYLYTQPKSILPTRNLNPPSGGTASTASSTRPPVPPVVQKKKKKAPPAKKKKAPPPAVALGVDSEDNGGDNGDDDEGNNQSTKFRAVELKILMSDVEDIKPIGKLEWDRVTTRYNAAFPLRPRAMRNLRNRFNAYANKKPPTGDPDCPPLVKQAKRITELIKSKAGLAVLTSQKEKEGNNDSEAPVIAAKRDATDIIGNSHIGSKKNSRGPTMATALTVSSKHSLLRKSCRQRGKQKKKG
jgi:hypothetical protein